MGRDPEVSRFLERQSVSSAEAAEQDVAEAREATPTQRWEQLVRLSRSLAWIRTQPHEQQARVLEWRDRPAPSYHALVARLRALRSAS